MDVVGQILVAFWSVLLEAAPWLTVGLVLAGVLQVLLPMSWLMPYLSGRGWKPVFWAAVLGTPLPLCSCGVVPAALGLRRGGASRPATVSFLIATPENGLDSIALSYALLGPVFTVIRPVAAIFSAVLAGMLTYWVQEPERTGNREKAALPAEPAAQPQPATTCGDDCCGAKGGTAAEPKGGRWYLHLRQAAHATICEIYADVAFWLLAGLGIAAIINVMIEPAALARWGTGWPAMLVMLAAGIPMYICATASTPVAAGLLLAGVSPGAVLVFLLAGPATNVATLAIVARELGRRTLLAYLAGIAGGALLCGWLTDLLLAYTGWTVQARLGSEAEMIPVWLAGPLAVLLLALALPWVRKALCRHPAAT